MGIGRSKLYEDFVSTGRLRLVRLGPRCVAAAEDELDALMREIIAERDAKAAEKRRSEPRQGGSDRPSCTTKRRTTRSSAGVRSGHADAKAPAPKRSSSKADLVRALIMERT
jgi:hypothetical protein